MKSKLLSAILLLCLAVPSLGAVYLNNKEIQSFKVITATNLDIKITTVPLDTQTDCVAAPYAASCIKATCEANKSDPECATYCANTHPFGCYPTAAAYCTASTTNAASSKCTTYCSDNPTTAGCPGGPVVDNGCTAAQMALVSETLDWNSAQQTTIAVPRAGAFVSRIQPSQAAALRGNYKTAFYSSSSNVLRYIDISLCPGASPIQQLFLGRNVCTTSGTTTGMTWSRDPNHSSGDCYLDPSKVHFINHRAPSCASATCSTYRQNTT